MQFGLDVINFGQYGDPREFARIAQLAEAAGWDGLFVWDHLAFVWGMTAGDPWVLLTAAAAATHRIKLGPAVTPVARRRPHNLAFTLATLDRMTDGRMIFGVGLGGVPEEFTAFGEPGDPKVRAEMLDEGLEIIDRLWSGEKVNYHGNCYNVENVTLSPVPVQRPRIPIWVGGASHKALMRAVQWDGFFPDSVDQHKITRTPEQLAAQVLEIRRQRPFSSRYDVVFMGYSNPGDTALVRAYRDAGATWWLECLHDVRGPYDEMIARIKAGPPRI